MWQVRKDRYNPIGDNKIYLISWNIKNIKLFYVASTVIVIGTIFRECLLTVFVLYCEWIGFNWGLCNIISIINYLTNSWDSFSKSDFALCLCLRIREVGSSEVFVNKIYMFKKSWNVIYIYVNLKNNTFHEIGSSFKLFINAKISQLSSPKKEIPYLQLLLIYKFPIMSYVHKQRCSDHIHTKSSKSGQFVNVRHCIIIIQIIYNLKWIFTIRYLKA